MNEPVPAVVQAAFDERAAAAAVNAAHGATLEAILVECRLHAENLDQLEHGDAQVYYGALYCSERTARMMASVGRHQWFKQIGNSFADLPASWGTLAVLTRIDPDTLARYHDEGRIGAETTRAQAEELVKAYLHEIERFLWELDKAEALKKAAVNRVHRLVVWAEKLDGPDVVPEIDDIEPGATAEDIKTQTDLIRRARSQLREHFETSDRRLADIETRLKEAAE